MYGPPLAVGGDEDSPTVDASPDDRDVGDYRFVLDAVTAGHAGPFNTVSRRGHATTQTLLDSCIDVAGAPDARLTWVSADVIERAGIEPWTQLPIWLPLGHEYEGLHGAGVERAHAAGLSCRPVSETVADTWAWMRSLGGPPPLRAGLPAPGVDAEAERAALSLAHAAGRPARVTSCTAGTCPRA